MIKSNKQFRRHVISWFLVTVGVIVFAGGFVVYQTAENHLIESFKKNKLAQIISMAHLIDGSQHQKIINKNSLLQASTKKLTLSISKASNSDGFEHDIFSVNFDKKSNQLKYAITSQPDFASILIGEKFILMPEREKQLLHALTANSSGQGISAAQNGGLFIYAAITNDNEEKVALLIMHVNNDTLAQLRKKVLSSMIISFGLLGVLLMTAALLFTRKVTAPVELLNQAITRFMKDDVNFKLAEKSFGSLSFLAKQFNLMITRLHLSRTELVKLNKAYSRFVPHQLLKQLSPSGVIDISLGDCSERVMTILFCDIRGFTAISESMSPSANFKFINRYLSQIAPVINKHGGIIDKYLGDGIMALFPNGADEALTAAIEMIGALEKYNQKLLQKKLPIIEVGIGLHSGKTMLGTVGTSSRMDATVISDSVNAAARVEAMTKAFCTNILITEETKRLLKDLNQYQIRYIASCQIKGKSKLVTLYEVYNNDSASLIKEKSQNRALMIEAWNQYKKGDSARAIQIYQRLMEKSPHDKSLFALIERCQTGRL